MKSRRAYTLIEMLVVVALLAAIFTALSMVLARLRRADQAVRANVDHAVSLQRLNERLRQDAHRATAANLTAPADGEVLPGQLTLTASDSKSIEYRIQQDGVIRKVMAGEVVEHHERFAIANSHRGKWSIDDARESPLVSLWLPFTGDQESPDLYPIQAAVGISRR